MESHFVSKVFTSDNLQLMYKVTFKEFEIFKLVNSSIEVKQYYKLMIWYFVSFRTYSSDIQHQLFFWRDFCHRLISLLSLLVVSVRIYVFCSLQRVIVQLLDCINSSKYDICLWTCISCVLREFVLEQRESWKPAAIT